MNSILIEHKQSLYQIGLQSLTRQINNLMQQVEEKQRQAKKLRDKIQDHPKDRLILGGTKSINIDKEDIWDRIMKLNEEKDNEILKVMKEKEDQIETLKKDLMAAVLSNQTLETSLETKKVEINKLNSKIESDRVYISELKETKNKDPPITKKAREPIIYWDGQIQTANGKWRFENKESAKNYAKSLKGEEALDFIIDWWQVFTERKYKTAGKRGPVGEVKNAEDNVRCESTTTRNGETVRCKCKFKFMRGDRKICGRHNSDADNHLAKYENWKIEYGTHMGWWDDLSTHHRDWDKAKHPIRKDWVKPTRVKKD